MTGSRSPRVFRAFWSMGRQETLSYPFALVNRAINLFAAIFLLFYASQLIPAELLDGTGYVSFALVGLGALQLLGASLGAFTGRLREMQVSGLLEACFMTRTPAWLLIVAVPSFALSAALLRAAVLFTLAIVFGADALHLSGLPIALAYLVLGLATFVALGLISAAITLVVKRGDPIARLVSLGSVLIAGPFIPRDTLPEFLAVLGAWFPISPMLDGMRLALFGTASTGEGLPALLRLLILAAVLVPAAAVALPAAIRRMQRDGSAGQF